MDRTRNHYRSRRAPVRRSGSIFWPLIKWALVLMIPVLIVLVAFGYKRYQEFRADMPSLESLRAQLLGLLNQPAGAFVRVLNAAPSSLVNVLQAKVRAAEAK